MEPPQPLPDLDAPVEPEDLYNEKDPNRLKEILERQKEERYATEVSTTKEKILDEIKKLFDETVGTDHLDSLKKDQCVTEVNDKYLKWVLRNKRDVRMALKKGLKQIYEPKPGYLSNDRMIQNGIRNFCNGDLSD